MRDATLYARQWAGLVALARLIGEHLPGAELIERDGMVASIVASAPNSSLMNAAMSVDPAASPTGLDDLAERFASAGAATWGLWVDGADERAAKASLEQ